MKQLSGNRWVVAALSLLAFACGEADSRDPEAVDETGCHPFRPSTAPWSSLRTSRPVQLTETSPMTLSGDARFVYALGAWLEAGRDQVGVFRSGDLGVTWCHLPVPAAPYEVIASPASPTDLFVRSGLPVETLLRSRDGGASFSKVTAPAPSASLFPSFQDPDVLVAVARVPPSVKVSSDGGRTWTQRALPPEISDESWLSFDVDPTSTDRLFVASLSSDLTAPYLGTDDGGQTWYRFGSPVAGPSASIHLTAAKDGALYAFTAGGWFVSSDWGRSWSRVDTSTAPSGYVLSSSSAGDGTLFGWDASAKLVRSMDGARTFDVVPTPAHFQPKLFGAGSPDAIFGAVPGAFTSTVDAGQTWREGPLLPAPSALVQSPVAPELLWTTEPAARSSDGGITWTRSLAEEHVVPDGGDANVVFTFSREGPLRRSDDRGETWQALEVPANLAQPHALASCPAPSACLYLLYREVESTKANATHLARSADGGRSWETPLRISDGVMLDTPEAVAIDPDDSEHLLLGSEGGLAETRDAGQTWTVSALPQVAAIASIAAFAGGVRVVASHGGGLSPAVVLRSTDDGATWTKIFDEGQLFIGSARGGALFFQRDGDVLRSDDNGATWSRSSPTWENPPSIISIAERPGGGFLATMQTYGLVAFK